MRTIFPLLLLLPAALFTGCATTLPPEISVHTTIFPPKDFRPWTPSDPATYRGTYYGEMGDTAEYLRIAVAQEDGGYLVAGSRITETASLPPQTKLIGRTSLRTGKSPGFKTADGMVRFVIFEDPNHDLFPEPVQGLIYHDLFYAKASEINLEL